MTTNPTADLKQRASRAIIAHAFFRLESALTVCLVILLAFFLPEPFPWWRWWFWLILGAVGEGLIVFTSITDERTAEQVVGEMLREKYDPGAIKTPRYREKVTQALDYREQIDKVISHAPAGVLRDHLADSTAGISDWIGVIFTIAQRLDVYERDELLRRDAREVPVAITDLKRALAHEQDADVRAQIQSALVAKQGQSTSLDALQSKMEQAQFRLEETITALGTVYSQFQLIQAQKLDSAAARTLVDNIHTQVQGLQDILTSMNEVYKS
jgi:hypothetical protein